MYYTYSIYSISCNLQIADDGKDRERETVTVGEEANTVAACGFCNM